MNAPVSLIETRKKVYATRNTSRKKCIEDYGAAGGMAAYYGLQHEKNVTAYSLNLKAEIVELENLSSYKLNNGVLYHFHFATKVLVRIVSA
jgi:hypothetical protein